MQHAFRICCFEVGAPLTLTPVNFACPQAANLLTQKSHAPKSTKRLTIYPQIDVKGKLRNENFPSKNGIETLATHNNKKNYIIKFVPHIHITWYFNFGRFWDKKIGRNEISIMQSGYGEQTLRSKIFWFMHWKTRPCQIRPLE